VRVRSLIALDERGERSSAFGHALDQLSLRAREVTGVLEPCAPRPAGLRSNFGRGWQFLSSLCCDSLWPRPCNRIRTPDWVIQPVPLQATQWRCTGSILWISLIWTEGRRDKTPVRLDKYSVRLIFSSLPCWSWSNPGLRAASRPTRY